MMLPGFLRLVTGDGEDSTELGLIASHLRNSLSKVADQIIALSEETVARTALYGPFLARSLIELSLTSLIGRLDPFRLLVLREMQMRLSAGAGASLTERCMTAIQWTGDIRPKEKDGETLWSPDRPMEKVHRTLLGKYYDQVYWRPAFVKALDAIPDECSGLWFDQVKSIQPEEFTPRSLTEIDRAYSLLSKGVHHEFVIPPEKFYGDADVFDLLRDSFRLTTRVALVSHFIPTCQRNCASESAIQCFAAAQKFENALCRKKS